MNGFRKIATTAIILTGLTHTDAFAAGFVSGTVVSVRVDQTGHGMVFFSQAVGSAPPSCVISAYANALAFDANTAGGKAVLALALAAKATGAVISASGLGTCAIFSSFVEDWDYGVAQ